MARYWLTPVIKQEPFTMGQQRIALAGDAFERFRSKLQTLFGPRFLLSFKTALLLSADDELCGGVEEPSLDLAAEESLVFDGQPLYLSHCAQAFFDRLPSRKEWRTSLAASTGYEWTAEEAQWLSWMNAWLEQDFDIVLLKEESS